MALFLANILAVVSGLLGAVFLLGVLNPRWLVMLARRFVGGTGVGGAVAIRLLLAALLWFSAPVASTPATFSRAGVRDGHGGGRGTRARERPRGEDG